MPVIVDGIQQGTPEWRAIKLGVPSAGSFSKIVTSSWVPSKQRGKYMEALALERITGVVEQTPSTPWMARGLELEPEARNYYSFITGQEVRQVGFVFADEQKLYGASPDGLVDSGGVEIKCPSPGVHVKYLLGGVVPPEYFMQVIGNMLCADVGWWDFLSYCPGHPHFIVKTVRLNNHEAQLRSHLHDFCSELDELTLKMKEI